MVSFLFTWLKMHIRCESGQDLIEYALLGGLIAAAILGALLLFSDALTSMGEGIANCIDFDGGTNCTPGP